MRLVDADALRKFLHEDDFNTPDERWKPESEFAKMIDVLPTVDIKTEAARVIFAEIEEWFSVYNGVGYVSVPMYKIKSLIAELKNKYTKEGVGDDK